LAGRNRFVPVEIRSQKGVTGLIRHHKVAAIRSQLLRRRIWQSLASSVSHGVKS